jgi:hypothetical protein
VGLSRLGDSKILPARHTCVFTRYSHLSKPLYIEEEDYWQLEDSETRLSSVHVWLLLCNFVKGSSLYENVTAHSGTSPKSDCYAHSDIFQNITHVRRLQWRIFGDVPYDITAIRTYIIYRYRCITFCIVLHFQSCFDIFNLVSVMYAETCVCLTCISFFLVVLVMTARFQISL